ncbi:hypothetical protein V8D89_008988 [Ganoderma adspersum]
MCLGECSLHSHAEHNVYAGERLMCPIIPEEASEELHGFERTSLIEGDREEVVGTCGEVSGIVPSEEEMVWHEAPKELTDVFWRVQEPFQLSHNQIDFDAPNFFSTCFSSGFTESTKCTLTLDCNPALFALIIEYLSRYPILSLSAEATPPLMSLTMAHHCLLTNVQFYGLQKLSALLTMSTLNLDTCWIDYATQTVDLHDLV